MPCWFADKDFKEAAAACSETKFRLHFIPLDLASTAVIQMLQ